MSNRKYLLSDLAQIVGAEIMGDPDCEIYSLATLQAANSGQLSFLDNNKYRKYLSVTKASAVILSSQNLSLCKTNALVVSNPYLAFARIAKLFQNLPKLKSGIHSSAVVGEDCLIPSTVTIGANCVLGNKVTIGENTQIYPGSVIGDHCKIGSDCRIWANVTLYYGVTIGDRVEIHSGVVLGADGFGLAPAGEAGFEKMPQLGAVHIGNDVEIGANTTIDRGAIEDTMIGNGVKLDNQIQIGHNVRIGDNTVIAGCTGIAGSAKIGNHCMIGGGAGILGHLEICDHVMVTAGTGISKSITEPGIYASGIQADKREIWKKNANAFRHLGMMYDSLKIIREHLQLDLDTEKT